MLLGPTKSQQIFDGLQSIVTWEITGTFLDRAKRRTHAHTVWYLRYSTPKRNADGTFASVEDRREADRLSQLPIRYLLRRPESKAVLSDWPWNARRQTFCTYPVAKHQSAAKTALIMRHRGSAYTMHNSYRGLGVTPEPIDFTWPVETPSSYKDYYGMVISAA